jgi:hypothetical protein
MQVSINNEGKNSRLEGKVNLQSLGHRMKNVKINIVTICQCLKYRSQSAKRDRGDIGL